MHGSIRNYSKTNCKANKIIREIPFQDRPYEKLELKGSSFLTDSELLAIIIKTGTKSNGCLKIAQNILKNKKSEGMSTIEYLDSLSTEYLKKFDGIGRVKALQIKALVELSKRFSKTFDISKVKITSPKNVFDILAQDYLCKRQEILKIVILNRQNQVIMIHTAFVGKTDQIDVGVKECLSEPIKNMASSIILVHNHPGGALKPSKQDIDFTKKIEEYSKIFSIKLLDHVIIANNNYISLKQLGYL